MTSFKYASTIAALLMFATANVAEGANCALRSPNRQIYEMLPDASSYRSIVDEVDIEVKPLIEQTLGSKLKFSDLGKHTLYLVLKDRVPIGFVHARSEVGQSGSVGLIWALDLDLDLRIRDFRIQRSREKHSAAITTASFRDKLVTKDAHQLRKLLSDDNTRVNVSALELPQKASVIAHTAVLCGAKTALITDMAFRNKIRNARLLGNIYWFFPKTNKVVRFSTPLNDDVIASVRQTIASAPSQIDVDSFTILRAVDDQDRRLGVLVFSRWSVHPSKPELWWAVSPDGVIEQVAVVGDVKDHERAALSELAGKDLTNVSTASHDNDDTQILRGLDPARLAHEVLAILAAHRIGK